MSAVCFIFLCVKEYKQFSLNMDLVCNISESSSEYQSRKFLFEKLQPEKSCFSFYLNLIN